MTANPIPMLPAFDHEAIAERRRRKEFFWADLTVPEEASFAQISEAFGLGEGAIRALGEFRRVGEPSRRLHVDSEQVVFPYWCAGAPEAPLEAPPEALNMFEVNVALHGDYLLTVHEASFDLQELVGAKLPAGRSERYAVYVVLDAMTRTLFHALFGLEQAMGNLEEALFETGGRTRRSHRDLISSMRARLTVLRSTVSPQRVLFERVGEEVELVPGLESDDRDYFDRIQGQLDRAIESIDGASQALSSALEVQLNDTTYRLTIVATIFLPLAFITGFFGMNFDWMVTHVDSAAGFWGLGVGALAASLLLIVMFLRSQGAVGRPAGTKRPPPVDGGRVGSG